MTSKAQQFEEFVDRLGLNHFRGGEFTPYWSRTRNGVKNSLPHESLWPNVVRTIILLDHLRVALNAPITMLSTYRSPAYNAAISGEPASLHMEFKAIDFSCGDGSPKDWAKILKAWRGQKFSLPGNGGQFEFRGGVGVYGTFVHIDTRGYDANWKG